VRTIADQLKNHIQ